MTQLLPIVLVAAVMAVNGGVSPLGATWPLPDWLIWMLMWLTPALLVALAALGLRRFIRQLRRGTVPGPLIRADRIMRVTRWLIVAIGLASVLLIDGLGTIRRVTGNLILVDELLAIAPALLAVTATWWVYYPIENLLTEAMLIRRLDTGQPTYPTLTRGQYVLLQARLHLLLMLVPVLMIAGFSEAIDDAWTRWRLDAPGAREALTALVAGGVFLFSPLLAKGLLDVQSLPQGSLRDMLVEVCRRHRIGVRDLLLWRTNGSMINAAVMGVIAPLRYVLITDALLEMLQEPQVRAVMAHEVGHVRRHHMVWMIVCLLACFTLAAHVVGWSIVMLETSRYWSNDFESIATIGVAALQLVLGLTLFGWVCRRFERQADTFAVQHLSGLATPLERDARVSPEAVQAMHAALATISELNTVDPARHSWRHGSIHWRQMYLQSIIGRPLLRLPIDRLVRWLKVASAIVLALGIAYQIMAREAVQGDSAPRFARTKGNSLLHGDRSSAKAAVERLASEASQ